MNRILLIALIGGFSSCMAASFIQLSKVNGNNARIADALDPLAQYRQRRNVYNTPNIIEDCMTVTSKDGLFYYKAIPQEGHVAGTTCGLYLITDPNFLVEIEIVHLDLSCEGEGLISIVDGWELNGEFFPSSEDHPLPMKQRVASECGSDPVQTRYVSSQNAALVQYRVPIFGEGFSLRVRYVKNPQPCNILVEGTSDVYTLSNHGRRVNCSVTTLFPATVSLVGLDVGATRRFQARNRITAYRRNAGLSPSTGIMHKCEKDYLQIGGSSGLDTANLNVADSVCGVSRESKGVEEIIACGITTVRLVSSGRHRNAVQVAIRPAEEEELLSANFMCTGQ